MLSLLADVILLYLTCTRERISVSAERETGIWMRKLLYMSTPMYQCMCIMYGGKRSLRKKQTSSFYCTAKILLTSAHVQKGSDYKTSGRCILRPRCEPMYCMCGIRNQLYRFTKYFFFSILHLFFFSLLRAFFLLSSCGPRLCLCIYICVSISL